LRLNQFITREAEQNPGLDFTPPGVLTSDDFAAQVLVKLTHSIVFIRRHFTVQIKKVLSNAHVIKRPMSCIQISHRRKSDGDVFSRWRNSVEKLEAVVVLFLYISARSQKHLAL
jgi:hypothetical protein